MKRLIVRAFWLAFLTTLASVPAAQAGLRDVVNGSGKAAMLAAAADAVDVNVHVLDMQGATNQRTLIPVIITVNAEFSGELVIEPIRLIANEVTAASMEYIPLWYVHEDSVQYTSDGGVRVALSSDWGMRNQIIGYLSVIAPREGSYECSARMTVNEPNTASAGIVSILEVHDPAPGPPIITLPERVEMDAGSDARLLLTVDPDMSAWAGEVHIQLLREDGLYADGYGHARWDFAASEVVFAQIRREALDATIMFAGADLFAGDIGELMLRVNVPGAYRLYWSGVVKNAIDDLGSETWCAGSTAVTVRVLPGDASLDAMLSRHDLYLMMRYLLYPEYDDFNALQVEAMDADNDGRVSVLDVVHTLRAIRSTSDPGYGLGSAWASKAAVWEVTSGMLQHARGMLETLSGDSSPEAREVGQMIRDLTGTADAEALPVEYALGANYPNPFNPATTISYDIAEPGKVRLGVYNAVGQLVEVLANGFHAAGSYEARWNAGSLGNGTYFYVLEAGDFRGTGRMVLLK